MKRSKRLIAGFMVSVMAASALAGCSSSKNTATETEQTQSQTAEDQKGETRKEETTAAEKGEPVEMEWLVGQTSSEVDDDAEVVKAIEERFNIDLKAWYVDSNKFWENLM